MLAFVQLVGGVRAASFLGTALLLAILLAVQTVRLDGLQDKQAAAELASAQQALAHQIEIGKLERAYSEQLTALSGQLIEDNENAKNDVDKLLVGLRDGTERLRRRFQCPQVPGDSTASSGSSEGTTAGFGVADAEVAFGIARDGDSAIRQLTACQQAYSALREQYGKANTN